MPPAEITLDMARGTLSAAVLSDALDSVGLRQQAPRGEWRLTAGRPPLVGWAKTTLWDSLWHADPAPYALELQAVDACQADDVFVAAAGGSDRSGIWGELLTTAAQNRGCVGALIDGGTRDVARIDALGFPVFARGTRVEDSLNRQRVVDLDVVVELGGVRIEPRDLIFADADGVVVVPHAVHREVLARAWDKVHAENVTRDAIRSGLPATEVYRRYGVL